MIRGSLARRLSIAACFALGSVSCGVEGQVLGAAAPATDAGGADVAVSYDAATLDDVYGVFAGQTSTCALERGAASCWGNNAEGELGTGDHQGAVQPGPSAAPHVFDALSLGDAHACGIEHASGSVYCWGYNAHGQLGQGDTTSRSSPTLVALPAPASTLATGYRHSCAITKDGALYCWGDNTEGQIGLADMYGAGDALAPKRVGAMSDWVAVAGGDGHTCAIRGTSAGGTMWCWGRNTSNECGQGSGAAVQLRAPAQVGTANRWTSLDLGQDDALALAADHTLWGWGDASQGNLSGGNGAASLATPTQIGSDADWQSVSTDAFESCAIKASGDLYCWGRNAEGQLGLGDTNDRYSPTQTGSGTTWSTVSVGRFHMCASSSAHTVSCAGENADGQLGVGDVDRRNLLTVTGLVPVP